MSSNIDTKSLRRAVIPAAGRGTRMFPASHVMQKTLLPVITADGVAKPLLLTVVEEAFAAGIEEITLVINPEDEPALQRLFSAPARPEAYDRLPVNMRKYRDLLPEMGRRLNFVHQTTQEGFGHAVYCARESVGNEPFLLLLGDHLYLSSASRSCAEQLLHAWQRQPMQSMLGVYCGSTDDVPHCGTVAGDEKWGADGSVVPVRTIVEKPSGEYARRYLSTPGLGPDRFLCIFGLYVLSPAVFDELGKDIETDRRDKNEIQLTTALESLRSKEGMNACLINGEHLDAGQPVPYFHTLESAFYHQET